MSLKATRACVHAVLDGTIGKTSFTPDPVCNSFLVGKLSVESACLCRVEGRRGEGLAVWVHAHAHQRLSLRLFAVLRQVLPAVSAQRQRQVLKKAAIDKKNSAPNQRSTHTIRIQYSILYGKATYFEVCIVLLSVC